MGLATLPLIDLSLGKSNMYFEYLYCCLNLLSTSSSHALRLRPAPPLPLSSACNPGQTKITNKAAVSWTPEASWRTKSGVDFDWGVFSPEVGVDRFGTSPYLVSNDNNSNNTTSSAEDSSPGLPSWNSSSLLFPADYFTARFTGFGKIYIPVSTAYHIRLRIFFSSPAKGGGGILNFLVALVV